MKAWTKGLLMTLALGLTTGAVAAEKATLKSGGMQYEILDSDNGNQGRLYSSNQTAGLYAGRQVANKALDIKGQVTGSLIIESTEKQQLSFEDPAMTKVRIGGGFWVLKFVPGTELTEKLAWVKQQKGVLSADIEVRNNLKQPR
ncbi:hypothetical protein [Veronia pacifica]|uniref:Uncharacterized protein n=1 Tax=Veronia pacifica TaxID=1080227 RepID=A0A1C3ELC4_9GAMM|nr:hypothetical protein [Veronia pacifica]ODA34047.1 hypothetical protein A8L45_08360 [Veronia pacifica]